MHAFLKEDCILEENTLKLDLEMFATIFNHSSLLLFKTQFFRHGEHWSPIKSFSERPGKEQAKNSETPIYVTKITWI